MYSRKAQGPGVYDEEGESLESGASEAIVKMDKMGEKDRHHGLQKILVKFACDSL
jgi:hypothetical protein